MTMDMMDFTLKVNTLGTFNVAKQVAQTIAKQEPFTEDGKKVEICHMNEMYGNHIHLSLCR
jgi:hypothetical protein